MFVVVVVVALVLAPVGVEEVGRMCSVGDVGGFWAADHGGVVFFIVGV